MDTLYPYFPSSLSSSSGPEITRASLELLYHVSRELSADLDLRTVLQRMLLLSVQSVGAINGSIIVLDDGGKPVESAIIVGGKIHENTNRQLKAIYDHGLAGWVARHLQAALVPDTSQDERWLRRPDDAKERSGPKSAVSVPIQARERLVGVITLVHPSPGLFTHHHLALVQAIADQAGMAILHAQLFERLQTAHQRYRELFEDSIDSIVVTDLDGKIQEANRQVQVATGLDTEVLRCLTIGNLHQVDLDAVGPGFTHLTAGRTISYESILRVRGGRAVPIQVYARQVCIEGSAYLQWILHDITERKNLDSLREDLISMIYHDLRSPLGNVVSSLNLMAASFPEGDDGLSQSLLNIALRSTERIQRLTDSLLDISRLEAGQPTGIRQPVAPFVILADALESIRPAAERKSIQVHLAAPPDLPAIRIDQDMIRRVLINLLENAIKFTPGGGKIDLGARLKAGFVEVWVKDTGPGIPPAEQEKIFEKFARLQPREGPSGLGLGLAFCRLAVLGHGGRIWVESEDEAGSSFNFTLPIAAGNP